jgi:hypothetical protein
VKQKSLNEHGNLHILVIFSFFVLAIIVYVGLNIHRHIPQNSPNVSHTTTQDTLNSSKLSEKSSKSTAPSSAIWIPPVNTSWQWQLLGKIDQSPNVAMFDIDLFENSESVVQSLHNKGSHVVCYIMLELTRSGEQTLIAFLNQ